MGINERLKNAKTTNWLSNGLSVEQISQIKQMALIAAQIQLKRIELGLNQKEFAKLMGVSQGMVSKWESGDYNFTICTLNEICNKLNLDFSPSITCKEYCSASNYNQINVYIDKSESILKYLKISGNIKEIIA